MKKGEIKEELYIFSKTLGRALKPSQYPELSKRSLAAGMQFFTSLLIIMFFVTLVVMTPKIMGVPTFLDTQLSQFSQLKINTTVDMKGAILIPVHNPKIVIDTTGQYNDTELLLINSEKISHRFFFREMNIPLAKYKNLETASKEISGFLFLLFLMILPALILIVYIVYLIKLLIAIILLSGIVYLILRAMNYKVNFKQTFVTGLYSSVILVVVESLNLAFMYKLFFVHYIVYFLFFLFVSTQIARRGLKF